jgi:ABC-type branched-subunit amino acid transport system ATPase component
VQRDQLVALTGSNGAGETSKMRAACLCSAPTMNRRDRPAIAPASERRQSIGLDVFNKA